MQADVFVVPEKPAANQRDAAVVPEYHSDALPPQSVDQDAGETFTRHMQAAMMPHHLPSCEDLTIGMCFFPGAHGGGDLFDAIKIADEIMVFLMLDARGAGERAVCLSAMVKNSFMRHLHPGVSPFSIVERVNRELLAHVGADFHLQAFLGVLDLHSGELSYCNAGGAAPVVYRAAGRTTEVLATHGAGIAVAPDGITGESRTCIGSGDCLVLFSRGMYRLFNLPLEKEKNEMAAFVAEVLSGAPVEELPARLTEKYHREKNRGGLPIDDDISLLFAAMLTTSVKTQLRESLGFNVDDVVYLQFLNYLEEMDRVTAVILSAMDFAGYPDELIRKMKIVLTELLVNAVIHGNGKESMKRVVIGHLIDRDRTVISIMDEGDGFDPSVIPDPTLPENIDKPCGRGLFIVRHYVETIRFNRTGNRVTIIKKNQR